MPKRAEITRTDTKDAERLNDEREVRLGTWYWYRNPNGDEADQEGWLGCVTRIGTNFVQVESPHGGWVRVHMDAFDKCLAEEKDYSAVIQGHINTHRDNVERLMGEVKQLTASLGVSPRLGLPKKEALRKAQGEGYALATVNGSGEDMHGYKARLVKAKKETLPGLFKEIEQEHAELATWMTAETLPLRAGVSAMGDVIETVEDRIFNVSLYAGLTEDVVQIAKGKSAGFDEKLRLLQLRRYMDEECLLNYEHGGMEYRNIGEFDEWMARPENMDRLLPFPRCMVAMRIRQNTKDRGESRTIDEAFIKIKLGELDKLTFLFIRNGENLWRLNCDQEFDELLFPDRDEFDLSEPYLIKVGWRWGKNDERVPFIDEMVPKRRIDAEHEDWVERKRLGKQWDRKNPFKQWRKKHAPKDSTQHAKHAWTRANPYKTNSFIEEDYGRNPRRGWKPFDPSNVYYDEATGKMASKIQHYNRIALIIQGLYDRSPVLHPHPPVTTWTPEGFLAAIELIYDGSMTLTDGDAPDFEAYCERLRERLETGSITIGQADLWLKRERKRENERRRGSMRYSRYEDRYVSSWWVPDGDPGPGKVARIVRWSAKNEEATYRWKRERRGQGWSSDPEDTVVDSITVPQSELFNCSAYRTGDYKQFFNDPRTREDYLQWADLMLTAEEVLAGNIEVEEPPAPRRLPKVRTLAKRIQAHLTRLESDTEWNVHEDGRVFLHDPRATAAGRFVQVSFINYRTTTSLSKKQAWDYLCWLDAGNKGTWYHFYEERRE